MLFRSIGGETAEMPGFYDEKEYDLAGFTTGVVDREKIIDNKTMAAGDVIIALPSSGVHSNGFSLVRKVFPMTAGSMERYYSELSSSLGETLIAPTKIYVRALSRLKDAGVNVLGCSHITGGGFYENIPRMLTDGMRAIIKKDSYPVLPIFGLIEKEGGIEERMMYNTFNMGLGMVLAVRPDKADLAKRTIEESGEKAYIIGEIKAGDKGVELI